jgi:3-isopropylmalate/(R)-2-methylmalate dehydratase small subunit
VTAPLVRFAARATAMLEEGIDTDVIFPARFLLRMEKDGLGECLFADRRDAHPAGAALPFAFPLEQHGRPGIILAGPAFGSGSSREHAVWALADYGIKAVIAPSFGEIFASNAARNGLAALRLEADKIAILAEQAGQGDFAIDLETSQVTAPDGALHHVDLPEQDRLSLINGWDQIDLIDALHGTAIEAFERDYWMRRPWLADQAHLAAALQKG